MTTPEESADSLESRRSERPFFDESRVPEVPKEYVCWLDVMGAESAMRRSHRIAANFVMKLHVSALVLSAQPDVDVYPVIDGMYLCSPDLPHLLTYLKGIMTKLSLTFIFEDRPDHRFMARGALAFGPVIKGRTAHNASVALEGNPSYADRILLGIPLVQAYADERRASPLGIYIHESARSFAPEGGLPLPMTHWKWWTWYQTDDDVKLARVLEKTIQAHLEWCIGHSTTILYPLDRIREHQFLAQEYFSGL